MGLCIPLYCLNKCMKDSNIFDDLMNLNADEWNQSIAFQIGMPLGKLKTLIAHQELMLDVGSLRLQINKNDITKSGKEQLAREKTLKKQYKKLFKDDYKEAITTLKNYVVTIEDDDIIITSIACTGKIIVGIDFSNSQLENSYFNHCIFYNCNFTKCHMESSFITSCSFINCNLNDIDLIGATLARNSFLLSDMTRINYTYAVLSDNAFVNCDLSKSNFLQARILFSGFNECHLIHESFRDTELGQVTIINSNLYGSDFKNTDVLDSIFTRVDLLGCSFKDFTSNSLTLVNCKYDEQYKELFVRDNLTYNPSIVEWDNETDRPKK